MVRQNLIFYPSGCYGTLFEWFCNFLENYEIPIPFLDNGSSHKFRGNFLSPKEKLFEYIKSNQHSKFSRTHPGLFEQVNKHEECFKDSYDKILQRDIDFLKNYFAKILVLIYDENSLLWYENNNLDKTYINENTYHSVYEKYGYTKHYLQDSMVTDHVLRIKYSIDKEINSIASPFTVKNLQGWNKNSIHQFEIWELRELLSFYWFTRNYGQIQAWETIKNNNTDLICISISELQNNFVDCIIRVAQYFDFATDAYMIEKIVQVHKKWLPLQNHITKDLLCKKILNALCNQIEFDWNHVNLSIIDEAWIQKQLYDRGIGIKCDGLDVFPTNSKDFMPLLEKL